ncbi:hypothetical protein TURU_119555 [Turdus rufiventris]|nr:hypothetical protein TURU_119555 [Turdus rufiventris]
MGTGPLLELRQIGKNGSGHNQCQVSNGDSVAESPEMKAQSWGDSAPVTFIWLHNGHQVARGSLLELGAVHVEHSGTYQCVATNQLGQDRYRVFQALSPELELEVTPQGTTGHLWNTGAQTPQLLVEPPWTPATLGDKVTLTCQGSGTAGGTTWYKDRRRWWKEGPDSFTVTDSDTYA